MAFFAIQMRIKRPLQVQESSSGQFGDLPGKLSNNPKAGVDVLLYPAVHMVLKLRANPSNYIKVLLFVYLLKRISFSTHPHEIIW